MIPFIQIAVGLGLLFAGGNALVSGGIGISRRFGLSAAIVGAVVLGFGTSTPELMVSLQAALAGSPDIALGNVVGSNIANIGLILCLAALIAGRIPVPRTDRGDRLVMIVAAVALALVATTGAIGRGAGIAFLGALAAYLFWAVRRGGNPAGLPDGPRPPALRPALLVIAGLVGLIAGANLLVAGAVALATIAGISEAVIGLTVVAVGTSLPELAATVIAALRKETQMAVGNIVGSNIFNILAILGVTALVAPVPVAPRFVTVDLPVMIGVSLALVLMERGLGRAVAALGIVGYGAYVALGAPLAS